MDPQRVAGPNARVHDDRNDVDAEHESAHGGGGQPGSDNGGRAPEAPPRGDVVEVPGGPVTIEYEEVRSPPPWLTPLAISVVALFAVFVVTRAAVGNEEQEIALSQAPAGEVPTSLADGSELPGVPEIISSQFSAPVIGTARVAQVPDSLDDRCSRPFDEEQLDPAALQRINQVVDAGSVADLRIGPEVVSVLRAGPADSPPGWPDTWVLSCLGRFTDDGWVARPPRLDFARAGDRGASDPEPGVAARIARVPGSATWAAQERDGWWLAAPVQPGGWVQLVVSNQRANEPVRVVFLDEEGNVVADERLTRPAAATADAEEEQQQQAPARTLEVGVVSEVLSAVQEGPIRACAEDIDTCVWVSQVGAELEAHAAYGPHHLDVPPFGELGWCPGARRFQGTVTRSQFNLDGEWRSGLAPSGTDGYQLRFEQGNVVVDLGNRMPGAPASGEPRPSVLCTFEGEPTGSAPEDQDAIAPL